MEKLPYDPEANSPEEENDKLQKPEASLPMEILAHQEEIAHFDEGHGRKTEKPLERAKKYLKILLAGAVLTFGGKMIYEKQREHTEKQESIEYVFRSGLQEKAERAGCDFKVDVPNGDGPYIAHIGWMHSFSQDTASAQLLNELAHDAIVKNNEEVERLLLSLKEEGTIPVVFAEGYDEQSVGFLEFISSQRDKIMSVEVNAETLDRLVEITQNLPPQEQLPRDAKTSFEYLVSRKLLELFGSDTAPDDNKFAALKTACEQKLESFNLETARQRMIKEGAALKTHVDGEYKIAPAESSVIREDIRKREEVLSPLIDKLGQLAELANKGSAEARKEYGVVSREYNRVNDKLHREKVLNAREDFAVKLIKDVVSEKKVKHGFVPILYGTSHDFSDNVRNLNKSDGKERIGLVTLIPKSYKGTRE